jgi:hypothetical protein
MDNETEYYFHIGLPKTATSYLQKNFFPLLDIVYLGKHYDSEIDDRKKDMEFAGLFSSIFVSRPFDLSEVDYRKIVEAMPEGGKILYSNELMSGSSRMNFCNAPQIAHHLSKAFPGAKVIFVLRRQDLFVESIYRQAIRGGYHRSVAKFLSVKRGEFGRIFYGRDALMDIHSMNYLNWVEYYAEVFGEENLLVLPYEMLKSDRRGFLERISSFMGVEYREPLSGERTNGRDSYALLCAMRLVNSFVPKKLQNRISDILPFGIVASLLNAIGWERAFLDEEYSRKILSFHEDTNRELSRKYGLELERYGYFG